MERLALFLVSITLTTIWGCYHGDDWMVLIFLTMWYLGVLAITYRERKNYEKRFSNTVQASQDQ